MFLRKIALIAIMGCISGQVAADVINFNEAAANFQGPNTFTSGSLTFSSTSERVGVWLDVPDVGAFNGTPYLLDGYSGILSFERSDLQAFALSSFDIALGWYQPISSGNVTATYFLNGGGSIVDNLLLNLNYQTFSPDLLVNKVSFDLSAISGGYISLDNIVINNNGGNVPESTSLALLGVGLAGLSAMRHKNKKA